MLNYIIHEDEITVWWDKEIGLDCAPVYTVSVNEDQRFTTKKTYCTVGNLLPDTDYKISLSKNGVFSEALILRTKKKKRRIDVTGAPYLAVGDGVTVNTKAIQGAIDDCGKDACVYFPKGVYLTGALDLHSDMEIYLDDGAILQGSVHAKDYLPKIKSRFEGLEMMCYRSLLNLGELDHTSGVTSGNVVIRGKGEILGGGAELASEIIETERAELSEFLAANAEFVKECENNDTIPGRARGRLIQIANSEQIVISGLRLGFAASWNLHYIYSKNIAVYGCTIDSRGVWNGDGIDPDSSEDSVIFNCEFFTHDNSIAVKSGKNPEGNIIGRPTRNISIFDCRGYECIGIGSEMSGGISDVHIWDCDFSPSRLGLSIKMTQKRGGYLRNIFVTDSIFSSIRARCVAFNDDGRSAETVSVIKDFVFRNVTLTGVSVYPDGKSEKTEALLISGLEGEENYFNRFTFENLHVKSRDDGKNQTFEIKNVKNLVFNNLNFD